MQAGAQPQHQLLQAMFNGAAPSDEEMLGDGDCFGTVFRGAMMASAVSALPSADPNAADSAADGRKERKSAAQRQREYRERRRAREMFGPAAAKALQTLQALRYPYSMLKAAKAPKKTPAQRTREWKERKKAQQQEQQEQQAQQEQQQQQATHQSPAVLVAASPASSCSTERLFELSAHEAVAKPPPHILLPPPSSSSSSSSSIQSANICTLYANLLAEKLKAFSECERDVLMHEIDNVIFRAKMLLNEASRRLVEEASLDSAPLDETPPLQPCEVFIKTEM